MIDNQTTQTLVTFLVGGGLATLVTQGVRGILALRKGAHASTRAVIVDLYADRDEAERRRDVAQCDLEYFRDTCGEYSYQMRQAGLTPDPAVLVPPSAASARRPVTRSRRKSPAGDRGSRPGNVDGLAR